MKGLSMVGSSRDNGNREKDDYYPTPAYATLEILKREQLLGSIWECACGDGAISEVLKDNGYNDIYSSDLIDRGYGDQLDFLTSNIIKDNIITNPPFNLSLEFILKAKECTNNKIIFFLRTTWLESEKRYNMFQDKTFALKTVYQFSKRVTTYKSGVKLKNSGMMAYAWFVWEKGYIGKPTIEWIL